MILYAIDHYKVNPARVYVTGGSSGGEIGPQPCVTALRGAHARTDDAAAAMMSNAMAATYPELIAAVALYSGVPAGCFVSSSGGVDQWNNSCSGGSSKASADQWGNVARAMYPGYTGARPKMQIWVCSHQNEAARRGPGAGTRERLSLKPVPQLPTGQHG